MRLVIQRVKSASVDVAGERIASIGPGLLVLVAAGNADVSEDVDWLVGKTVGLRIFDDEQGVMNLDVRDVGGEILAVSQFTLLASTRKGNRPSYMRASSPAFAAPIYDMYCNKLERQIGAPIGRGRFGADMQVSLVNDGPVTIIIDSKLRE